MAELRYTFSDTASAGLARAKAALVDLTPAMRAIADHLEFTTRERFETSRGPDGVVWKPSRRAQEDGVATAAGGRPAAEATAAGGRPAAGKTLVDTGMLLASITRAFGPSAAVVGTNLIYAAPHQFGGTIRAKGAGNGGATALKTPFGPRASVELPARPFLGFSAEDRVEIEDILRRHIVAAA